MKGINKIVAYINAESDVECGTITQNSNDECARIRADYSRVEQDEYWKYINAGTKEAESRLEKLKELAIMESNKLLLSTKQEMIDEAFALAAKKLLELPQKEYGKLLKKLGFEANAGADEIVELFKDKLSRKVASVLFD